MSKQTDWVSWCARTWPAMIDDAHLIHAEAEIENVLGVTRTWNEQPASPLMPGDASLRPVSRRLGLLAAEAHRRELLTEGQLSRLLRLGRVDLRRILDAADDIECLPHQAAGSPDA